MPTEWGRTTVLVHDMDAARDFYRAAFGFRTILDSGVDDSGDADARLLHLGFTGSDSGVWLIKAEGGDALRVGRQTGGAPLGVLYVDDVDAALRKAVGAGARMLAPVESDESSRFARVRDLYGNEIVLAQLNRRKPRASAVKPTASKSAAPKSVATKSTTSPSTTTSTSATPKSATPKAPPRSARPASS